MFVLHLLLQQQQMKKERSASIGKAKVQQKLRIERAFQFDGGNGRASVCLSVYKSTHICVVSCGATSEPSRVPALKRRGEEAGDLGKAGKCSNGSTTVISH